MNDGTAIDVADDAAGLIASLRDKGVQLRLEDGRLRYDAPRGVLDAAALSGLRARREEIMALLRRQEARPEDGIPASPGQARLWFIERAGLADHSYVTPVNLRITGDLDPARLRLALEAIVHRHDALRTAFVERDGRPIQLVHAAAPFEMPVSDLSSCADPDCAAASRAERQNRLVFDLAAPPLLRAELLKLGPESYVLLAAVHHIAFDGWSMPVFLDELGRLYGGERLPPLRLQVPELVARAAHPRSDDLAYWRAALDGLERTDLPTDRQREPFAHGPGEATRFHLPAAALALAQDEGATPFVVLLTAFLLALGRETGQSRPSVGVPVANRTEPGSEALIGFLVNTLVLRADLTGDPSFRSLLRQVRATWVAALGHAEVPFDRVVEALQPTRSLHRTPLFSILFAVQDADAVRPRLCWPGVQAEPFELAGLAARFDLEVHCWPEGDAVAGIAVRDTSALDAADVVRVLDRFRATIAAAAASPDAALSRLPALLPAEAARLAAWNATSTAGPAPLLHALFETSAARTPAVAAVEVDGAALSYAALEASARRIARALRAAGAGPETPVALCLDRGPLLYAAMLGILMAGACVVSLDPADPAGRHAAILATAGARLGLVDPRLAPDLTGLHVLDAAFADGPEAAASTLTPDNLAAIIFTSGSTGQPKGVEVTHRALANVVAWHASHLQDRGRRTLGFTHQSFDVFFQETFTTWALGGTLVPLDAEARRDPERVADCVEAAGLERLFMPFTPLMQCVAELGRRGHGHHLTELHTAGEAVLATPALHRFLGDRPGLRLVNHYGPTEAFVVTAHQVSPTDDPVPIGRPVSNVTIHVLDPAGRPAPPGAPGQIAAGGWGVARGYRGRPDLTAERFRPDPSGPPGARIYLTGDRGRIGADDALRYLGRGDDQLKLRGFRVEPAEIQRVLLDGPELEAATVGLQDGRLVAHVVCAGADPMPTLRARLRERLPPYMQPAAIVPLPSLPTLPNGKVDRAALPPPPEGPGPDRRPRSALEESVAALFAETLGRSAAGMDDDFFAYGGHSLLATQLVSRIRAALGVELPLRTLFEAPTPAGIAAALEAGTAPAEPPRPGLASPDLAPLSFAQQRLWLLDRLGLVGHAYTMPVTLRLHGELDVPALAATLRDLAARHEPLRTIFREINGEPVQAVLPPALPALVPIPARDSELADLQRAELATPFTLDAAPPFRMRLLRLGPTEHVLLGAIHHIAADGWSLQVIVRELGALYRHHASGAPLPAAPKLRYADFACWQRSALQGEREARHLAHWRSRLAGVPPLALPLDRQRPGQETFRGASAPVHLPPALARRLASLGQRNGATPFMVLLAGFLALLHRLSGQARFAVGAPVANRNRGEVEHLVGFFVNALPLDTECGDDPSFATHLERVREACLAAFTHQDLPFERLVQDLAPDRDLSSNPVFNTIFAVQAGETMAPRFDLPGLEISVVPPPELTVRFDLELHLWPSENSFRGFAAYNRDLFDPATIETWLAAYLVLLDGAAQAPQTRLSALPLTEPGAARASLAGPPAAVCDLVSRFAEVAAANPDAQALIGDGLALSYRALDARSDALMHALQRAGVGAETVVALLLDRGPDAVIAMLGVLKAGGAYLPLDPQLPAERRTAVLADARVDLVLGPSLLPLGDPVPAARREVHPDRLACVMYTSGSTGAPKGVAVSHANIASRCIAPDFMQAGPGEVVLQYAPLAFDASTLEIWAPLLNGGTVAIAPAGPLSLAGLAGFVERQGVTRAWLTAGLFREMAAAHPATLRNLRQVLAGGDVVAPDPVRAILGGGAAFRNGYGPTETTIFALTHAVRSASDLGATVPIGRPVAGTEIHILDSGGQPVPPGLPGELWVGGAGVARGYLGQPGATADRFRPDPFGAPGARLYRTGDRAVLRASGAVEFLGRSDRQVKIRGFRVEPGEVEAVIRAQPGVADAIAGTVAGPGGEPRLVAWVVPAAIGRAGHLRAWTDVFDQRIYAAAQQPDPEFDTTGWLSSYTGAPIPAAEMRDWTDETVQLVCARQPDAVLEPGCGTGLLLRRIAPHTRRYVGTEISQTALDRLDAARLPPHVELRRQDAADFAGFDDAAFDCVLLSSVVQYFPSLAYLRDVLVGALRVLRPGGVVHLADLRDLRHQRRLALALALAHAADSAPASSLRAAALHRVSHEAELLLDPALFATLPGVAAAELRLQQGRAHNELTRYRYTAILHTALPGWTDAVKHPIGSLAELEAALDGAAPLVATGLPNARLADDMAAAAAIERAAPDVSAAAIRAALGAAPAGIDPADVIGLAKRRGLLCVLAPNGDPDRFDAGFHAPGSPPPAMPAWRRPATLPDRLANDPVAADPGLVAALRQALERLLPAPLVPSAIVTLPRVPLTAIGKVDRAALPLPHADPAHAEPPRGALETAVAAAFAKGLGLARVSRDDDFFSIGGHSLLAARIAADLRAQLGREVPLRLFFEAPTVAGLAARLAGQGRSVEAPPIRPDPQAQGQQFPLTAVQQAYWIGRDDVFAAGGSAAHIYFEVDAAGLDLDRFEQAWTALVQRHGMLRAVINRNGTQRILAEVPPFSITRHAGPEGVRERLAAEIPDCTRWPLFRLEASRLGSPSGWRLHVGIDSLIIDAHSLNLLFVELRQLYDGAADLAPLSLSFRDVVLARLAEQETEACARSRAYWMARLDDLPDAPALPQAPLRVSGPPRFVLLSHRVEAYAWGRIQARAGARGLSPNSVVLAAFAATLAGWSERPSFTLNLTRFDRPALHPEIDRLVGDFTALSLLAVECRPGASLAEAAQSIQRRLWQDLDHPHPGAVELMREISRRRGRPPGMLFPIVFTSLLGLPGSGAGEDALQAFGPVGFRAAQTPQVWLDHGLAEIDGGLAVTWNLLDGAFPPGVAEAMFGAYLRLLHGLAADDQAWDRPALVALPAAQQAARAAYNRTTVEREPTLLHAGLLRAGQAQAERAAVIAGGRSLSHAELAARAGSVRAALARSGVGPGQRIGIALSKGWEQAVACLGVLRSGSAYLPLDPGLPAGRVRLMLADAGVRIVLTHSSLLGAPWAADVLCLAVDQMAPTADPVPDCPARPADLAYVIYTSGSTGRPKGVAITHGAAANTLADLERRLALSPQDRVLALSSLSFDLSVWDLFGVPGAGGAAIIPVGSQERDPRAWRDLAREHQATLWNSVPQLLQMRLDAAPDGPAPRAALLSGDWIPLALVSAARHQWPQTRLVSLGGATEAAIWSILHEIGPPDPAWPSVPYGAPMENQTIHVLDPTMRPRPDWVVGDLYIGGAGLAHGYLGDPDRTAAAFLAHPETGERIYRTGDLARVRPGGVVEFLGRQDGQVKINGFRVELGEVEAALSGAPGVSQAAATVAQDQAGGRALVGFVTARAGTRAAAPDPALIGAAARAAMTAAPHDPATADIHAAWAQEQARFDRTAEAALARLGIFAAAGERWEAPALMARANIVPRYGAWIERALRRLAERGALARTGTSWTATRPFQDDPAGERLAAVLTEQLHSAQLYADPAIPALYERIFGGCHQALAAAFDAVIARLPADQPVRVLEVGAGYGTATRHLLPKMPPGRGRYLYTDISRFFLDHARSAFAGAEGLEVAILDLDRPASTQGVPPGSIDIIVAASVLHDARRIAPTLADLSATLAPGGLLLAIEETCFHPAFDLGMGLQQGFDRMEDRDLRPLHPLLSRPAWETALHAAGFGGVAWVARPGSIPDALGFDVLLAQAGAGSADLAPDAVLGHARRLLPDYMVPGRLFVLPALPLSANGKLDRAALAALVPDRAPAAGLKPRTPLEAELEAIWARLLGLEELGVETDLFAHGADSLVATRAVSLMRDATGVELPFRTVFERPTIAALAEAIETRRWVDHDPAPAAETVVL